MNDEPTRAPILVTEPPGATPPEALAGRARDPLVLGWEERRFTRRRARTAAGREVALALPTGTVLAPGAVLAVGPDFFVEVEAAEEPVLAAHPRDGAEAVRLAFEVGNRHYPLAQAGERLLVPDDAAMRALLARLGARFEARRAPFDPIGGGGHRHG
jgi:urease accessory protein